MLAIDQLYTETVYILLACDLVTKNQTYLSEKRTWYPIQQTHGKRMPEHIYTPIRAMGCWQCLPLSVVLLKGKHCRKPHCRNGVVDRFWLCLLLMLFINQPLFLEKKTNKPLYPDSKYLFGFIFGFEFEFGLQRIKDLTIRWD